MPTPADSLSSSFDFSRRIPQLDGVRGLAILLVLVYHYGGYWAFIAYGPPRGLLALFLRPITIGWCGVDLFFVLSGFLIGGILLDAKGSSNYFRAFYARRICRILPLYAAFLVAVAASMVIGVKVVIPWRVAALFVQNFWMAKHRIPWGPLGPTWSLAVEEQFYLGLPALLYFVNPRRLTKVLAAGIIAAPLLRTALFLWLPTSFPATFVLLPCRMDSLLIGVAAAWALRLPGAAQFLRSRRRQIWTAMEILTIISSLFLVYCRRDNLLTDAVIYDSLALVFASLISMSLVDERLGRILRVRWLRGLGEIAYGAYLLQIFFLEITRTLFPSSPAGFQVLAAAMGTIVIAKASWEYFEKPIVKLGHRAAYSSRPRVSALDTQRVAAD